MTTACSGCDVWYLALYVYLLSLMWLIMKLDRLLLQLEEGMLKPNLHAAICNLQRQEKRRGLACENTEFAMERYVAACDAAIQPCNSLCLILSEASSS